MTTRAVASVVPLILFALIFSPSLSQADPWDATPSVYPSGDVPLGGIVSQPNGLRLGIYSPTREMSMPVPFGVRFTAWWNDLNDSSLDFRSDFETPQFFPSFRPEVRQRVTHLSSEFRSPLMSVNLLAHRPFAVSAAFPEGRWSPYVGVGTGPQVSPIKVTLMNEVETSFAPALQVVAGVQLFISRALAVFSEYRFSPANHPLAFTTEREGSVSGVNRFIGGFALHF